MRNHLVSMSLGVSEWIDDADKTDFIAIAMNEHFTDYATGVCAEDAQQNADAWIRREIHGDPGRIMTVHQYDQTTTVWIITDWWHNNNETHTTVLFPQEY